MFSSRFDIGMKPNGLNTANVIWLSTSVFAVRLVCIMTQIIDIKCDTIHGACKKEKKTFYFARDLFNLLCVVHAAE